MTSMPLFPKGDTFISPSTKMKTEEENKAYWFKKSRTVWMFLELYYNIKKQIFKRMDEEK